MIAVRAKLLEISSSFQRLVKNIISGDRDFAYMQMYQINGPAWQTAAG
jgi:hypothetical protein